MRQYRRVALLCLGVALTGGCNPDEPDEVVTAIAITNETPWNFNLDFRWVAGTSTDGFTWVVLPNDIANVPHQRFCDPDNIVQFCYPYKPMTWLATTREEGNPCGGGNCEIDSGEVVPVEGLVATVVINNVAGD